MKTQVSPRRPFLAATLALLWLCYASALGAAQTQFAHGLLWEITPAAGKPSYVFGTIHSDDPRVTKLPEPVKERFDASDTVVGELVMNTKTILEMTESMFYADQRTLRGVIGDALFHQTQAALRKHGVPADNIDKQKPWVPTMALSMPKPKADGVALDLILQMQAAMASKPVEGLETVAEQVGVFDNIPVADQIALLKYTLQDFDKRDAQIEQLMQTYLARDLAGMMALIDKLRPANAPAYDQLMERLLKTRNQRMVERMKPLLARGNAFIAIGAAHLAGTDGVLPLLERAGYRVRPLY